MWRNHRIVQAGITAIALAVLLVAGSPVASRAETANVPSLIISQLKITSSNGQFITLYNTTNTTLDMSGFQLEYFNNYDLSKATSSRLIPLTGSLPPHSYYMVNDNAMMLCYQLTVDSVSLGLSSTAGLVEVLSFGQTAPGGSVAPKLQDHVAWSKTAASGAQTLPANTNASLLRQPLDVLNNPLVETPGSGSWLTVQPDVSNPCKVVTVSANPALVPTGQTQLLPASDPPADIIFVNGDSVGQAVSTNGYPARDIGLMAPQVNELLPNPIGTGNDSSDEFIELYNPNAVDFDLTGFSLQTGLTSTHSYTFPSGTLLPARSFVAYYSNVSGLSLSNTSGQAKLIDPLANSVAASAAYSSAKDGQAWALAKGKWFWTTQSTPGKANTIKQPVSTKKTSPTKAKSKTATKVKSSTIKRAKTISAASYDPAADEAPTKAVKPWVLAAIGCLAVLYGAYEYRSDMAQKFSELRRNIRHR